ncbi:alpha-D-ribose 1-methylphosphonate 5-triphosphate diphosphatase [Crocosphaera sp.]|uniref:alpha-D-ribose 1-methylphosphonate 5-triphosphate diphosphatase n=1 Tax=Crocosphaera sp. TaxID=2729996 RepID=UPI002620E6E6|nr:alpha-D-ribose 1-methylphosphonate 5-triphosphate diphosphatase [Crocosphaera sp.]MDJ0580312.1 alpha-D-ribose 1-methylphosphonate 5-triphosphate diphosphatase [Crocosphaera sp.]
MDKFAIEGTDILTPDGWVKNGTVIIENGKFLAIDETITKKLPTIDAKGLLMLPGIVDIHGDAFERAIAPRPGSHFPLKMGILENDRHLIASGITTFFYSITDSYEPGLRSRETAREIIDFVLGEGKNSLKTDSRIHIRHEQANTDEYEELCDWLKQRKIDLLSLNDHLPPVGDDYKLNRHLNSLRRRHKMSDEELQKLIKTALNNQEKGLQQVEELVSLAHDHHIPLASHDDDTEAKVQLSAKWGVSIAEFPANVDIAAKSRDYGASVLMGAPNLIRGGSHVGWMSVEMAAKKGVVDCLCSDYHYPSLFSAPFKLTEMGIMSFEEAWKLVSTYPAEASGIGESKGKIAKGFDADFLLIQSNNIHLNSIKSVYIKGKEVARY